MSLPVISADFRGCNIKNVTRDQASSIISGLLVASLETSDAETALMRQPINRGIWASVCRFFRHLVYSKEECAYKDLRDTLRSVHEIFAKTAEVSYSVTPAQYRSLRERFNGEANVALISVTDTLEKAVVDRVHGQELHELVQKIQIALPKEILPCPLSQKKLYLEVKELAKKLASPEPMEKLDEIEARLKKVQNETSSNSVFAPEIELALFHLERRKIDLHDTVSKLFTQIDTLIEQFEGKACESSLLSSEKAQVVNAYKNALENKLDAILAGYKSRALHQIETNTFANASKAIWEALNELAAEMPASSKIDGAVEMLQRKSQALCATLGDSIQSSQKFAEMYTTVIQDYSLLLAQINEGKVLPEEDKAVIRSLISIVRFPLDTAFTKKLGTGGLDQLLSMNRAILKLLEEIDRKISLPEITPRAVPPVEGHAVTFSDGRVRTVRTQVAASQITNFAKDVVQGLAISSAFAAAGVCFGATLPVASVFGMGLVAASQMGSVIDQGLESRNLLTNRYVVLLSGMASMGLMAYFGPSYSTGRIARPEIEIAVKNATDTAIDHVVPLVIETVVNKTASTVIAPFLNATVDPIVQNIVNETVTEVVPELVNQTLAIAANAAFETMAPVAIKPVVEKVVPEVLNATAAKAVEAVMHTFANETIPPLVEQTVSGVADNMTVDFVQYIYETCGVSGLSQAACERIVAANLTPALKSKLVEVLTPELFSKLNTQFAPDLILQLREKMEPELIRELLDKLTPAITAEFLASFLPTLNKELLAVLPQELIEVISKRLTPHLLEEFTSKLSPELVKQLSKVLTEDLQNELKVKLGPEVFKNLLPLIQKVENVQKYNIVTGVGLVFAGAAVVAVAPIAVPGLAAVGLVAGAGSVAGGLAKIFGWT